LDTLPVPPLPPAGSDPRLKAVPPGPVVPGVPEQSIVPEVMKYIFELTKSLYEFVKIVGVCPRVELIQTLL
jgi:hypothetical protein